MSNLLKIEIDGRAVEVPHGSMVMDAANKLGIYVPHFCYHKKLSIAANCRMCLVQVEKAPKPLPACATPVTDGMKVFTHSPQAKQAQNGVMELLLINHPLDCPICDQGGECQLQDLAVGYGGSTSRYQEAKRVVMHKNMGPLISAEEMSRCIHCTRCVRFGQEVAGVMELGMYGRGEHSEILPFVGRTVDSELSGNMIDVCPVGALTSKPFRYSARTWELSRRKTIAPHDSLGSNLIAQVKGGKVLRVVPLENEEINECWISDRDRFSYEGLNSPDRLTQPMIRQGDTLKAVDWHTALDHAATLLKSAVGRHGPQSLGLLANPQSTLEELALAGRLMRGLGSENLDFRLRQVDFSADGKRAGIPWLGMKIAEIPDLDRVLIVGSLLRKDQPLLANRFRQAAKRHQQISVVNSIDEDMLIKLRHKAIVRPSRLPALLKEICVALAQEKQQPSAVAAGPVSQVAVDIAKSLASGKNVGIFLGAAAEQHPQASALQVLAQEIARLSGGRLGFFGTAANAVGGYAAQCVPAAGSAGLNAGAMISSPRNAYVLLNVEPELDCHDASAATRAIRGAECVVALSAFASSVQDRAQVVLPIAPFTETSGSFINTEGRLQSFNAAVKPLGEARPAWKVLRVLAERLGLQGFDFDTSEAIRDAVCRADEVLSRLDNGIAGIALADAGRQVAAENLPALERIADVPIYFADPLVRRAQSLQATKDAREPTASMNAATAARSGLSAGDKVKLRQGTGEAQSRLTIDEGVADGCVRFAAAHQAGASLGAMFGEISVERMS